MKEIWKVYKDTRRYKKDGICFHGFLYEVSNFGRVKRNNIFENPKILKSGYCIISSYCLHRMVAEMFIPNPENKPCIDHIDGNKLNNRADNLRWVTYKENNNNPITKKYQKEKLKEYYKNNPTAKSGEKNPMYGKNAEDYMTPEAIQEKRRKQSENMKNRYKEHPMSEETKQKSSKTWKEKYKNGYTSPMIGHVFSEERNKKISEANKGEKNGMYGKPPANKGKHFNKNTRHYE